MLFDEIDKSLWKKLIEASLYYEGKPVSVEEIAKKFEIEKEYVLDILNDLKKDYIFRDGGIILKNKGLNYYFAINPSIKDNFFKFYKVNRKDFNLTDTLKEVLSIIAYKQPITKVEIDSLRGADSSYSLRKLLEYDLIKSLGRKDVPGRPTIYGTTDNFLKVFGLSSLDELPDINDINYEKDFFGLDDS